MASMLAARAHPFQKNAAYNAEAERVEFTVLNGGYVLLAFEADLRRHRVDIVTIGQYLSPGPKHLPVERFVTPEQFAAFRQHGEQELGFLQVVSTPLTRSSYHAGEVQRLMAQYPR